MNFHQIRRSFFALLSLSLLFSGGLAAQTFGSGNLNLQSGSGEPAIEFKENVLELGTFKKGEVVTLDIPFKSSGGEDLEVAHVKPSCSCSDLTWTETALPPGESGTIHAEINTDEMEAGEKTKYFTVIYNGNPGVERVTVKFELKEPG